MKRLIPFITIAAFLAMAWVIFRADHNSLPAYIKWYYDYPGGDKLGHFILFGILAALLDATLNHRNFIRGWLSLPLAGLLVAVAETIEEASQAFYPSRSLDIMDILASWAGIALFVWITRRFRSGQAS